MLLCNFPVEALFFIISIYHSKAFFMQFIHINPHYIFGFIEKISPGFRDNEIIIEQLYLSSFGTHIFYVNKKDDKRKILLVKENTSYQKLNILPSPKKIGKNSTQCDDCRGALEVSLSFHLL